MPKRNLIWILIILVMAAVLLLVWRQPAPGPTDEVSDFQPVENAYDLIKNSYYQPVRTDELRQAAVRGMLESLDEFSTYVPPGRMKNLNDRIMGKTCGLGLVVAWPDSSETTGLGFEILGVMPKSPAAKADIIVAGESWLVMADDIPAKSENILKILKLLNAPAGTEVELLLLENEIYNEKYDKPVKKNITLTSTEFPVATVQGLAHDIKGRWIWHIPELHGPAYGPKLATTREKGESEPNRLHYIRLTEFAPSTHQELLNVLRRLKSPGGLVLDLRSNPGGLLPDGVAVADVFISQGEIVTILGRGGSKEVHSSHKDSPYGKLPMVVLIDDQTSSAAELLAGALAANARAVLLGVKTRGKGCIQTMLKLPGDLGQVNLTTAEFFVDSGQPIQRRKGSKTWGIEPAVKVDVNQQQAKSISHWQRKMSMEANLKKNEKIMNLSVPGFSGILQDELSRQPIERIKGDPQLSRAIELLESPKEYGKIIRKLQAARKLRLRKLSTTQNAAKKNKNSRSKQSER